MIDLLILVLFGFISSQFTLFLDWCMGNPHKEEITTGRIFSSYGIWIKNKFIALEDKFLKEKGLLRDSRNYSRLNFWKAAGMCPICMNVYVALFSFIAVAYFFNLSYFYLIPFIIVSHFGLMKTFN